MDTELYIVGKDVAELKISKKFRFEKISSDFKMSILLYGKIYGTILIFGIVLQKMPISGQLPVYIFENYSQKLQKCLGLELGVKANLKTLSPRSQFQLWAQTELSLTDMTNKMKFHSLQLTSHAPSIPRIYGTLRQVFKAAF